MKSGFYVCTENIHQIENSGYLISRSEFIMRDILESEAPIKYRKNQVYFFEICAPHDLLKSISLYTANDSVLAQVEK